ncbi:MAG: NAD(P)H-dependent oxidoreductase subunit E, partial [Calditrichia bacterium]|nr:NAD(P)H-dependent oxidoreductase subunit E [Calditrichia bacterium]
TENKGFSMETVNCLGACALSPLIVVNGKYHVKLDQNKVKKIINKIKTDEA